jgi:hypothetical protein
MGFEVIAHVHVVFILFSFDDGLCLFLLFLPSIEKVDKWRSAIADAMGSVKGGASREARVGGGGSFSIESQGTVETGWNLCEE